MLAHSKGKYCFGDEVTMADVFLAPHVLGGVARFGVDIEQYPKVKIIIANLQ